MPKGEKYNMECQKMRNVPVIQAKVQTYSQPVILFNVAHILRGWAWSNLIYFIPLCWFGSFSLNWVKGEYSNDIKAKQTKTKQRNNFSHSEGKWHSTLIFVIEYWCVTLVCIKV